MSDFYTELDNYVGEEYTYIKFGIPSLDSLVKGITKGTYGVVAGSSGTGKSLYSLWFFRSFIEQGYKTAYFNLELSHNEVLSRISSFPKLVNKPDSAKGSRIITGAKRIEEIENYLATERPDAIIIDWLGLIDVGNQEKYAAQRKIAHWLKKSAEKYNVAILLLNQVNKLSTAGGGGINWYSGNAGVSEIYDLCSVYLGIYDRINAKGSKNHIPDELKGILEIIVDKGRFLGQNKGTAFTKRKYNFHTKTTTLEELTMQEQIMYQETLDI